MIPLTQELCINLIKERSSTAHKYNHGKLLVVGGSERYVGAPQLTTMAAYRTGVGLVALACPRSIIPAVSSFSKETIFFPLPQDHLFLLESINNFSACVVGPGLGRSKQTKALLKELMAKLTIPTILDADALSILGEEKMGMQLHPGTQFIVTPHEGEMAMMLGWTSREVKKNREVAAVKIAKLIQGITILKGPGTLIAEASGELYKNTTGNVNLATAGTGDVLAGMIGSLLAQGYDALESAQLGVFLHGYAGDLWKERHGDRGMLASDLLDLIPDSYTALLQQ